MTDRTHSLEDAVEFFQSRDNFVIASHDPLDADAVGSEIALSLALEAMGKKAVILNHGAAPVNLGFLPEIERVGDLGVNKVSELYPTMATVDCGGYKNLRGSLDLLAPEAEIINVDHHIGNEYFGSVNYVDSTAAAAGTLVYRIIRALEIPVTEAMAWSLYAALTTDTGRFSYSNTDAETHRIAAELVSLGARPDVVYQKIYRDKPFALIQLEAAVGQSIRLECDGKVGVIHSTIALCERFGIEQKEAQDLIDIPMQLRGIEVALLLREVSPTETKVSFRSSGKVDVNEIATQFGGGGHRLASGCRRNATLDSAEKELLAAIRTALGEKESR